MIWWITSAKIFFWYLIKIPYFAFQPRHNCMAGIVGWLNLFWLKIWLKKIFFYKPTGPQDLGSPSEPSGYLKQFIFIFIHINSPISWWCDIPIILRMEMLNDENCRYICCERLILTSWEDPIITDNRQAFSFRKVINKKIDWSCFICVGVCVKLQVLSMIVSSLHYWDVPPPTPFATTPNDELTWPGGGAFFV